MQKENDYSAKMIAKTEAELYTYTENEDRYQEGAIIAAIWELEKRGITSEALVMLEAKLDGVLDKKRAVQIVDEIVEDAKVSNEPVPELYSPFFIRLFGVLFSVFGGSILMAINFVRLGKKDLARNVVLAALAYSVAQALLVQTVAIKLLGESASWISIALTIAGVYLLEHLFWNKHVSPQQKFIKRNFLPPLLIGIGIAMVLFYLLVQNGFVEMPQAQ